MSVINWSVKKFSELSVDELYELLQLRFDVFVIEQQSIYPDLDNKDKQCFHLLGKLEDTNEIVAYSRLLPSGLSYDDLSIGRVLTALKHRKSNFGKELMKRSVEELERMYPNQSIRISAQIYLIKFYNSFGFIEHGEIYDEDGIEHIEMVRRAQ